VCVHVHVRIAKRTDGKVEEAPKLRLCALSPCGHLGVGCVEEVRVTAVGRAGAGAAPASQVTDNTRAAHAKPPPAAGARPDIILRLYTAIHTYGPFAPPILNRGQVAIMYIKHGGLREIVVGEESGYAKNRPVLVGGRPPTGSQILSVCGSLLAFFKMGPRHPPLTRGQGGKRSIPTTSVRAADVA
jgi:hypothetical protein